MPPQLTPDDVRKIIREEFEELLASDRYIFHKTIQILDGRTIIVGKGAGTKIGTEPTQKIGFFGATPIVQRLAFNSPSTPSATYVQAEAQSAVTEIIALNSTLKNLGFSA